MKQTQCCSQLREIDQFSRIANIEILCRSPRSSQDQRDSADDHEFNFVPAERFDECSKFSDHIARRDSSIS